MKPITVLFALPALLLVGLLGAPAQAQVVKDSTCSMTVGSNTVTYDCKFHVKQYQVGSPLAVTVNYSCTGSCGPVMSFGLADTPFSPAGVSGHLAGGQRLPDGVNLVLVFDSLKKMGNGATGSAHFVLILMADDGTGAVNPVACPVDLHFNQSEK